MHAGLCQLPLTLPLALYFCSIVCVPQLHVSFLVRLILDGKMQPPCARCIQPQRGVEVYSAREGHRPSMSAFFITMKWFFVSHEMNMAHMPRAGCRRVDTHIRNRERRKKALLLCPPGSLADPVTGGLTPPSSCVVSGAAVWPSLCARC